jgi:hypothetical protein
MSPVKYEQDFISQKTAFFIVTVVKTKNLAGLCSGDLMYFLWVRNWSILSQ